MSTKAELEDQIEGLREDVGYWNGLSNEMESDYMRLRDEKEEVERQRDGFESELWDTDYKLTQLKEELSEAKTLEDFEEIVETLYRF